MQPTEIFLRRPRARAAAKGDTDFISSAINKSFTVTPHAFAARNSRGRFSGSSAKLVNPLCWSFGSE